MKFLYLLVVAFFFTVPCNEAAACSGCPPGQLGASPADSALSQVSFSLVLAQSRPPPLGRNKAGGNAKPKAKPSFNRASGAKPSTKRATSKNGRVKPQLGSKKHVKVGRSSQSTKRKLLSKRPKNLGKSEGTKPWKKRVSQKARGVKASTLQRMKQKMSQAKHKLKDRLKMMRERRIERLRERISTGRTDPKNLHEQVAMRNIKSFRGVELARYNFKGKEVEIVRNTGMKMDKEPKFAGMQKMEYVNRGPNGKNVVIHYVRDPKTGKTYDYKFKD